MKENCKHKYIGTEECGVVKCIYCGYVKDLKESNNSQQPKVNTCQGEEEMFKSSSEKKDSCSELVSTTRNPSADNSPEEKADSPLDSQTLFNKTEREKQLEMKIIKIYNFHHSHNIMTAQPEGVMAVSESKKLTDKLFIELINQRKEFQNKIEEVLKEITKLEKHGVIILDAKVVTEEMISRALNPTKEQEIEILKEDFEVKIKSARIDERNKVCEELQEQIMKVVDEIFNSKEEPKNAGVRK
jgi:hypothetical protein